MSKKRKFYKKFNQENKAYLAQTTILRFEEQNKLYPTDRIKNVFYCESKIKPEGRMCILWERTTAQPGDMVVMKVKPKGEIFLGWDLMIIKRATNS